MDLEIGNSTSKRGEIEPCNSGPCNVSQALLLLLSRYLLTKVLLLQSEIEKAFVEVPTTRSTKN